MVTHRTRFKIGFVFDQRRLVFLPLCFLLRILRNLRTSVSVFLQAFYRLRAGREPCVSEHAAARVVTAMRVVTVVETGSSARSLRLNLVSRDKLS